MISLEIPGQMTEGELRCLEYLSSFVPESGVVVEIGSLYGLSSYTWSTSVPASATVHCIDPWVREAWVIELVEKKIRNCPTFGYSAFAGFTRSCTNIVAQQGYSPDDFLDWETPVDLFFDDALHHNPGFRRNLRFWHKKVRPGGIMCGHDYCAEWPDVVREVDKLALELGVKVKTRQWVWWFEIPK